MRSAGDSLRAPGDTAGTLVKRDSAAPSAKSDIDTSISYVAVDSVVYSIKSRVMNMYGKGDIQYKKTELKSERIDINWDTATMTSYGVRDTSDTTGQKKLGQPILKDGGEEYLGEQIRYNFRTQKGKITVANTTMDNSYYHGEKIKKIDATTLYVQDGRFTSCSEADPHFYFGSPKMKVYVNDHIVAEPIYFYVADVPVFMLPFGVFPNQSGRRSGLIPPAFGNDARHGRYLSNFGYYWAMSDYTDMVTTFDWFARGKWANRTSFRYNKRYDFNGSISASYTSEATDEPGDPDYMPNTHEYYVAIRHHQNFTPTAQANVNFTFMSSSYFQKFSTDVNDILRQTISSDASFSKTFDDNSALYVSVLRNQNLITGETEMTLPSFSYSRSTWQPFKKAAGIDRMGSSSDEVGWAELINVGYSMTGTGQQTHRLTSQSTESKKIYADLERYGMQHNISVNASPRLGYFNITPSLSFTEKWYPRSVRIDSMGTEHVVHGFDAAHIFSLGVSASTKFYGMLQPDVLGITAFRHTIVPSVSFSYSPDFSEKMWGYYSSYIDTTGKKVVYNRFRNELYGDVPSGKQQSMGFQVSNIFEMKYATGDSAQNEQKLQLLNMDAALSYNFAATQFKLSQLGVNYRTAIGTFLNLSMSTAYDFYKFDTTLGYRVDKFLWNTDRKIARLTSLSFSMQTSLQGTKKNQNKPGPQQPADIRAEVPGAMAIDPNRTFYTQEEPDFSIPWNLSLSWSFSESYPTPKTYNKNSSINGSLSFNLTEKWQINASTMYDIVNKKVSAPNISINRDLHCWLLSFSWMPTGYYSNYRLELRIKAPQLQDLKLTRESSSLGTYGR